MERLNDAVRSVIGFAIVGASVILRTALFLRIETYRVHQKWLRWKYTIRDETPIRGYDAETKRNIEQFDGGQGAGRVYVYTSGSTREPKRIAFNRKRLWSTLLVFLSAMFRSLAHLTKNRSFFVMTPVQSDGSLTTLLLKQRLFPGYVCALQAPHCIQDHQAIRQAASVYGDAAIWLWILTISNPGLIYATNPSTIANFFHQLSSDWESTRRFVCDYVAGDAADMASLHRLHRRMASRGAASRLKRVVTSTDALPVHMLFPGLSAFCCWDGGYVRLFLDQIRQYLPAPHYRHVPMYSMSTEIVETVLAGTKGQEAFLPLAPGVLYEFVEIGDDDAPSNLRRPWELKDGHRYTMVVSDAYGLRRYQTEDVFECAGFVRGLPDLRFVQRRNLSYSFTGEKLTAQQLTMAYSEAKNLFPALKSDAFITCFPSCPAGERLPRYRIVIVRTSSEPFSASQEMVGFVEGQVAAFNPEYASKVGSGRLGRMSLEVIGIKEFIGKIVNTGGSLLSQFKFLPLYPRLWETFNDSACQLGR